MRLCNATTNAGEPCKRPATSDGEFCLGHDPRYDAQRRRTASRGGRGRKNTETRAVKKLMDDLTENVLSGELGTQEAHAVVALQNIKLRAIEIERRIDEADVRGEFEELKRELGIS